MSDRLTQKKEPRFDLDYAYGRQAEVDFDNLLQSLAKGGGRVEVKRKRLLDLEFYVEGEHDPGRTGAFKPSGIAVSEAEVWAYQLGDSGVWILFPAALLREHIAVSAAKVFETPNGSCPTRGWLVNLGAVLSRLRRRRDPKDEGG